MFMFRTTIGAMKIFVYGCLLASAVHYAVWKYVVYDGHFPSDTYNVPVLAIEWVGPVHCPLRAAPSHDAPETGEAAAIQRLKVIGRHTDEWVEVAVDKRAQWLPTSCLAKGELARRLKHP